MRLVSQNTKVESLRRAPLFEGLSRKELRELAKGVEDLEVESATVLCREGKRGSEFFVIVDGEVEITRDGKRLAVLGPGDFFGEISILENVPRTATVTARTPLRVFVLTRQYFKGLLLQNPAVEGKVLRSLAKRVLVVGSEASRTQ
jgi:CRP/FNR family cyclic AMP-dependent transcriptional regulator